jgi:hypothetical protein
MGGLPGRASQLAERQQIRRDIATGEEWRSMASMRTAFIAGNGLS